MREFAKQALRIAIVGAGPVGLSAAVLLKLKGLQTTVYERRDSVAQLPQAHVVNTRTNEIFREMGVFDTLAAAASDEDKMRWITWSASLSGTRFGRLLVEGNAEQRAHRRRISPVRTLNVGQNEVDRVLLDRLKALGGEVLFRHAVTAASTDNDKAELTVRDAAGVETRQVFDYVLACDGATSTVRNALGIEMVGPPSLARFASCYFKADLSRYIGEDTGPVHFIAGEDYSATFISFDLKTSWALMCTMSPDAKREDFAGDFMIDLVRRAVGDPLLELEVQSVGSWNMSAQVAAEFRSGPFFLVGDAAHRFPPTGGLGLNTGVQDAHNLAWKLAFVASGKSGPSLLDTYALERAPVAGRNCAHSTKNAMQMMEVDQAVGASFFAPVNPATFQRQISPEPDHGVRGSSPEAAAKRARVQKAIDHQRPHFDALKIEIGFRYGEAEAALGHDNYDYEPKVVPGGRLPHAWMAGAQGQRSTLDAYDKNAFTLMVGDAVAAGWEIHRATLAKAGVSIAAGDAELGAVLVRPDGHVLWHGSEAGDIACAAAIAAVRELQAGRIYQDKPPIAHPKEPTMQKTTPSRTVLGVAAEGIRPTKLAHVVLRSNERFEEVSEWYRDLLNAQIAHKDFMSCFMTYDDEHHRLAVVRVPGITDRPPGTVGMEHLAFTYGSLSDLLETFARLKGKGILPILTINHGATTSIYYEDPDRNRVELQVDNHDNVEDFLAFLRTGVMNANPIGLAFDADDMLAKCRAGVPAKTLQAYPRQPGPVEPQVMQRLNQN